MRPSNILLLFYSCGALAAALSAKTGLSETPPSSASSGEIRVAPLNSSNPSKIKDSQLAVAEGFYHRKEYELALAEFQKFLSLTTPGELHRDQALFHLAETYRFLDKTLEAQSFYQQLLTETPLGSYAASASFRLGEYYHLKKELKKSIEAFSQAAQLSTNAPLQSMAHYQEGICHHELGEQEKAASLFDDVSKSTEDKQLKAAALLLLAQEEEKACHFEKALNCYLFLSSESDPQLAAEACFKAGLIYAHQRQSAQALQNFEKAAALKEIDPWHTLAALSIMQLAYEEKNYQKVLDTSPQALSSSNTEECSQALLLTAQAERQLGHFQKALPLINRILKEFPGSKTSHDAAFLHLLLLQSLKDPSLLAEIQEFLSTTSDPVQKAQAELLQAEVYFQQADYAPAAKAYSKIKASSLSPNLKADAAYKEAWSLQHLDDKDAALEAYTAFLTSYPESSLAPAALLQSAYLKEQQGNLQEALLDYSSFLKKHPSSPQGDVALRQKALILKAQHDDTGMVTTFQQLLANYPKSAAAAEANYWIGLNLFEKKEYQAAIPFLEQSKRLDPKKLGTMAGVRLLLCHYYLEQLEETIHDIASLPSTVIPGEIYRWVGLKAYEQRKWDQAASSLSKVLLPSNTSLITTEVLLALATISVKKEQYQAAKAPAEQALQLAATPFAKATALLLLAKIEKGLHNTSKATSLIQEALLLQPEGRLNMEARFFLGELLFSEHHDEEAGRAFMAVALLTEDTAITPHALQKAAEAYERAKDYSSSQKALQELKQRFPHFL